MVGRDIEFPYVHDMNQLLSILEQYGETIPQEIRRAGLLTRYATVAHYPCPAEPVSEERYADAIRIAEAVVHWAGESIGSQLGR